MRVCGSWFYFVSVTDGYRRKILSWGLYESPAGLWAEIVLSKAQELYPDARARIITDSGSQFISKVFRELASLLEMEQTFTRAAHPEQRQG
jgi:transposase InsO family protein